MLSELPERHVFVAAARCDASLALCRRVVLMPLVKAGLDVEVSEIRGSLTRGGCSWRTPHNQRYASRQVSGCLAHGELGESLRIARSSARLSELRLPLDMSTCAKRRVTEIGYLWLSTDPLLKQVLSDGAAVGLTDHKTRTIVRAPTPSLTRGNLQCHSVNRSIDRDTPHARLGAR